VIGKAHVDFVGIPVRDLAAAAEFYEGTLGLPRSVNSGERWVEYDLENVTLALISPEAMGPGFLDDFKPNPWPVAFRVDDVEAERTRLLEAGVKFRGDIIDSGVCHIAGFSDPDGNAFILHHRYAPYADGTTA
jgi:predicted enzyme related to lactoylglutathione lyase